MKIKYVEERFGNQVFFDNQISEKEVNDGNSKRVPVLLLSDFEKARKRFYKTLSEEWINGNPLSDVESKKLFNECFGVEK